MIPDLKWLTAFLRATGWQSFAIAAACWLFLFVSHLGLITPLSDDWIRPVVLVGIVASILCLGSVVQYLQISLRIAQWYSQRNDRKALERYIPYMRPIERQIIGYLLARNQRTFNAAASGGNAMSLVAQGFIQHAARHGHVYEHGEYPFRVVDHLWTVLVKHKAEFPPPDHIDDYSPPPWANWRSRI